MIYLLLLAVSAWGALPSDFDRHVTRPSAVRPFLEGGRLFADGFVKRGNRKGELVVGDSGMTLDQWLIGLLVVPSTKGLRLGFADWGVASRSSERLDYLRKIHALPSGIIAERPVFIRGDLPEAGRLIEWRIRFGSALRLSLGPGKRPVERPYSQEEIEALRREALHLGGKIDLRLNSVAVARSRASIGTLVKQLTEAAEVSDVSVTFSGGPPIELGTFRRPIAIYRD